MPTRLSDTCDTLIDNIFANNVGVNHVTKKYPVFRYGDSTIDVVNDYVYISVTMNYNTFSKTTICSMFFYVQFVLLFPLLNIV